MKLLRIGGEFGGTIKPLKIGGKVEKIEAPPNWKEMEEIETPQNKFPSNRDNETPQKWKEIGGIMKSSELEGNWKKMRPLRIGGGKLEGQLIGGKLEEF